eukprot:691023-Amorphochlora_amoeboformis.AAC.1
MVTVHTPIGFGRSEDMRKISKPAQDGKVAIKRFNFDKSECRYEPHFPRSGDHKRFPIYEWQQS